MEEPFGDKLLNIMFYVFGITTIIFFAIIIIVFILQWLFPKHEDKFENILQKIFHRPLSTIYYGSLYCAITLFVIRMFSNWLGWFK